MGVIPSELCKSYRHGGFFVLRSPLLPFSDFVEWADGSPLWSPAQSLGGDIQTVRSELVRRLTKSFGRAEVKEALLFAAPRLLTHLDGWLNGSHRDPDLDLTIGGYFSRMCTRETPFGTFAGISFGRIANVTRLELGARTSYRRHTRPAMGFVMELLSKLALTDSVRRTIRYSPNSTLHRAFGRWRFAMEGSAGDAYPVADVEATPHLEQVLAVTRRPATLDEIANELESSGVERTRALRFAEALVQHRLLIPSWLPTVSGPEPFLAMHEMLAAQPTVQPLAENWLNICERLVELDCQPLGHDLPGLSRIARNLGQCGAGLELRTEQLLQADLVKPAHALTLSESFTRRLLRAAELVQRTALPTDNPNLSEFKKRFAARYDARRVPLVEALDADLGIGFGTNQRATKDELLRDLGLADSPAFVHEVAVMDELRLRILTEALQRGGIEYEIDSKALERFPVRSVGSLPESFAILAHIGSVDEQLTIVAPVVVAPSGIGPLARFCHSDPELARAVMAHTELEQSRTGQSLLADVAYLPSGQAGNILLRPVLRAYEIVYAGKSGVSEEGQIPISDLDLSLVDGKLELHSRRLGRAVSVRITNAHNVDGWWNLPIYRFLGAVEQADREGLVAAWSWGALEASSFLPRIVCEGVVLSRARWSLTQEDVVDIVQKDRHRALAELQALRDRLRLPRWVTFLKDELPLVIDLDNALSVEALLKGMRNARRIVLQEVSPPPCELAARGPEGLFVSDIIVPFVRHTGVAHTAPPSATPRDDARRSFPPGSEWLYAKIYAGISQLDGVIERVAKVLMPCLPEGLVETWFFIPYGDPEPHLRLRIRGSSPSLLQTVLPALHSALGALLETQVVYRVQLDTYERELERYGGGEGMALAEEVFRRDSDAVAELIALSGNDAELRWQLTLLGIDRLLCDFGLGLEERRDEALFAMQQYRREFAVSSATLRQVGIKYRRYSERLAFLLWPDEADAARMTGAIAGAFEILARRSASLSALEGQLRDMLSAGRLRVGRRAFIQSLVHMHSIRMLGVSARAHELVICDFLRRQYATRLALRVESSERQPPSEKRSQPTARH
jgi:thiopeptide-type bacteriocin biosynthesis protein